MVQPFRMLNEFGSGVSANTPSQKTGGPSPRQRSSAVTYSHRFFYSRASIESDHNTVSSDIFDASHADPISGSLGVFVMSSEILT